LGSTIVPIQFGTISEFGFCFYRYF